MHVDLEADGPRDVRDQEESPIPVDVTEANLRQVDVEEPRDVHIQRAEQSTKKRSTGDVELTLQPNSHAAIRSASAR
jgi:hypothetical protein